MFARIGRFCVRRRWFVLAAWVLVVLGGGAAAGPVFGVLEPGRASDRLESVQGFDLLDNAAYGQRLILLVDDARIADPAVRAEITAAARDIARIGDVGRVVDPYTDPRLGLVATDGRAAVIVVDLARDLDRSRRDRAIGSAVARAERIAETVRGATVRAGGDPLLNREINEQVQVDTEHAEVISLPLTLVVMVALFGGLLAAGLPLIGAVASVAGAFGALLGLSELLTLDPNTVPVVTLLGLGLSIDYSLLIVSRFREERAAGLDVAAAVERTAATAGRRSRSPPSPSRSACPRCSSSTTPPSAPSARPGPRSCWSRCWRR